MAPAPKKPAPKKKPPAKKKPTAKKRPAAKPVRKTAPARQKKPAPRPGKSTPAPAPRRPLWRRALRWAFAMGLLFLLLSAGWVLLYRFVNPPVTALMLQRHYGHGATMDREWRDLEDISPDLALAVLASEDQRFPDHHGFDTVELRKAIEQGRQGGPLRGASTLSQQVAKNAFLWPSRSWVRKGLEVYFTGLVELLWGKERILEVYLNIAEFGDGFYGAEAAARRCFGRSAMELTRQEAATLAAVLPSPRRFNAAQPSARVLRKRDWILEQMVNLGGTAFLDRLRPGGAP